MPHILAYDSRAIVTAHTSTDDLGVVDRNHGLPNTRAMTLCAVCRRRDVRWCLSGGWKMSTVMAAHAGLRADCSVTEVRARPRLGGIVANVARFVGHNVTHTFACRADAVVAPGATADDFVVIHRHHRCEDRCGMASIATIGTQNVARIFQVAARAAPDNLIVINPHH